MTEELMNFELPNDQSSIIKVIGVGGGGGNAVNHMFDQGIKDVNFAICNTDAQALARSRVAVKIQLGQSLTEGRGAGNKPEVGREAAIESLDDLLQVLGEPTRMVFITAGMGGGTGTGGAPVIAKAAKEVGLLTVAIVTIPFRFEGQRRIDQAIEGINELEKYVDALLVVNNEKLREVCGDMPFSEAFSYADNILATGAKGIAEIITVPGYINVDFADVETVLRNSGVALMGTGVAEGENRAIKAVEQALSSPLLNDNDITGTDNILLNITSGTNELTMDEIGEIADYVNNEVGQNPNIIWGTGNDESLEEKISITIIATGFESSSIPELYAKHQEKKTVKLGQGGNEGEPTIYQLGADEEATHIAMNNQQRTIDFDIRNDRHTKKKVSSRTKRAEETVAAHEAQIANKQPTAPEPAPVNVSPANGINDNIEDLENEPAYKRKKISIDQPIYSQDSNVSRYSLSDEDDEVTLRKNNSYLHDNVD